MVLDNPARTRVVQDVALQAEQLPQALIARLNRAIEKQHDRDLDVIASLVRVLKEPRGRQVPLAHELRELLRPLDHHKQ